MKKLQQSGIAGMELLLVVVLIGIIGFTGWFVYHSNQTTNQTLKDTNKATRSHVTTNRKTATTPTKKSESPAPVKAAADSPTPAAGTCENSTGSVVTVTLTEGIPDPRCSEVTSTQTLAIVNPRTTSVTATLGNKSVTIGAGKTGIIATPFGEYLQTGDHVLRTGLYGDSGPEIYLPAN
jgi:cytoskeletal protein RodZ